MTDNGSAANKEKKNSLIDRAASLIVKGRIVIFVLFAAACVLSVLTLGKVKINTDLTSFLPDDTETRRGIAVMNEEFETFATASVMVSGVDYGDALTIAEKLSAIDGVASVSFDDTDYHYKDGSALFSVSFGGDSEDEDVVAAMDKVKETVSGYETYILSTVGNDFQKHLAEEMVGVIAIAAVVIFAVLLFTSKSYFEVIIYAVVFVISALLNMGTNFWFGEISSITNSVAIILQLALAIDYAIIFAHRYQYEAECDAGKDALTRALSRSIVEISSSSLTTISGLIALTLMQFKLGYDLGIVLAKGIVCSMLTVLLLMPGIISFFPRVLKKTSHRNFVPDISKWGRFLAKRSFVFIIVFALVVPAAAVFSMKTEYAFSDGSITEIIISESREAMHRIKDTFASNTSIALIVPSGDYEKERELLTEISEYDGVKSATGIANIRFDGEHYLTDTFSVDDVVNYLGIERDKIELLFKAYAFEKLENLSAFSSDVSSFRIPLVDLALYLFDKIDDGAVLLTEEQSGILGPLRSQLEYGTDQLKGENYDRMILSSAYAPEDEDALALVDKIKGRAVEEFGEEALVIGDVTSARDLRNSYKSDSVLIALLTIAFVFLILLFTFKSPVAAILLVLVIQGSIWINFSIPYFLGMRASFVTQMIVTAIQMGATIDYAIVMMNRYLAHRKLYDKKEAIALAVRDSFPTVITSGTIMCVAALLIAFRVSDVYVGHIGFAVGRGALISVILVMTVLPQLIILFDKVIEKTTIRIKKQKQKGGN